MLNMGEQGPRILMTMSSLSLKQMLFILWLLLYGLLDRQAGIHGLVGGNQLYVCKVYTVLKRDL